MSKKFLISCLIIFLIVISQAFVQSSYTRSTMPPVARTGAPGELTCVESCHSDATAGSGSVNIQILNLDTFYQPGESYTVVVSVTDAAMSRFGFEMTALDGNNNKAGDFVQGASTSLQSSSGRQYVSHQNADGTQNWQFEWTAPSSGTGNVSFYTSALAANNNNNNQGDNIYLDDFSIQEDTSFTDTTGNDTTGTYLLTDPVTDLNIYPNPVQGNYITLKGPELKGEINIRLLNAGGKEIKVRIIKRTREHYSIELPENNLTPGLYFLRIHSSEDQFVKKLIVL